jgi:hypothetical protein
VLSAKNCISYCTCCINGSVSVRNFYRRCSSAVNFTPSLNAVARAICSLASSIALLLALIFFCFYKKDCCLDFISSVEGIKLSIIRLNTYDFALTILSLFSANFNLSLLSEIEDVLVSIEDFNCLPYSLTFCYSLIALYLAKSLS